VESRAINKKNITPGEKITSADEYAELASKNDALESDTKKKDQKKK